MWWPRIRQIPLKSGFDEARGEGPIVPVQDQVDGGKSPKGLRLIVQNIRWNDSDPEGIESSGGVEVVAGIGCQVVVVEGEFIGIPKEIEDTSAKLRRGISVGRGLRS